MKEAEGVPIAADEKGGDDKERGEPTAGLLRRSEHEKEAITRQSFDPTSPHPQTHPRPQGNSTVRCDPSLLQALGRGECPSSCRASWWTWHDATILLSTVGVMGTVVEVVVMGTTTVAAAAATAATGLALASRRPARRAPFTHLAEFAAAAASTPGDGPSVGNPGAEFSLAHTALQPRLRGPGEGSVKSSKSSRRRDCYSGDYEIFLLNPHETP